MPGHRWSDDWDHVEEFDLQVEVTPNPVVAVLLGPDGEPLLEIYERASVPFGFQPPS